MISAGAPVPANVIERFTRMLRPGMRVFTPYGTTEALPVASIGSDVILQETHFATRCGNGVCIGHPVRNVNVRIIEIRDDPIAILDDSLLIGSRRNWRNRGEWSYRDRILLESSPGDETRQDARCRR